MAPLQFLKIVTMFPRVRLYNFSQFVNVTKTALGEKIANKILFFSLLLNHFTIRMLTRLQAKRKCVPSPKRVVRSKMMYAVI